MKNVNVSTPFFKIFITQSITNLCFILQRTFVRCDLKKRLRGKRFFFEKKIKKFQLCMCVHWIF